MRDPLHLKILVPDEVRAALERDPRLLVPVGTCEQHGPHLPLGCDTILVERLADDLSAEFRILRAPTVEYGVNTATKRPYPGNATVRRKTLHRWMNELLGSWEQAGVESFIILTAHGHDPHQEALSTLRTRQARIVAVGREDDRKSTRLNSSHGYISYAVFCLKKKKKNTTTARSHTNHNPR